MSKKKLLLLNLPENIYNVRDHTSLQPPIGLAYISGYLKSLNLDVTLYDSFALQIRRERILSYVIDLKPDILGMTLMTNNIPQTIRFLEDLKKELPNLLVVLGGPHPTTMYASLLESSDTIDIAVIGEGEYTVRDIIKYMQNEIDTLEDVKGIAFRKNGKVYTTPSQTFIKDLDTLPFPDWASLPIHKYYDKWIIRKNMISVSMSRGCPYHCTFCNHTYLGNNLRMKSPSRVLQEIKYLYDTFNVRFVEFIDSTFNFDNNWLKEVCCGLIDMKLPISWGCEYRADRSDLDVLKLMKKSGCSNFFIGVESADNAMLKRMKKGETIEQIENAINLANSIGLYPDIGFIIGLPGETKYTINKTIAFAKKYYRNAYAFTLATPYPGTELYEIALQEGILSDDLAKHTMHKVSYVPEGMTSDELEAYYRLVVRKTTMRLPFIIGQVLQIKSFFNFLITLRFAYRLFVKRLYNLKG